VQKIKLKSAALTRLGKRRCGYFDLVCEAADQVLSSADLDKIGRIFFSSFAPRELCGIEDPGRELARVLRERFPGLDAPISGPYKTGGEALFRALDGNGGAAGVRKDTLLIACEKMTHVDAATAAGLLAPRVNPVEKLYGATLPALGALVTRAYMRSYGVPYRALHLVAVKNHHNATHNPKAHFRREIDVSQAASSPMVADPLRRHHCAPISDGAAACLIGAAGEGPSIRGWGEGVDARLLHERRDLGRLRAATSAARRAFGRAGVVPDDVDVVEIHDAFSPFELINLEELGFYRLGESWRALEAGELDVGARVAVNPSGGMKARGHPIGVCGLSSVVELFEQLTGVAGARQQPGARLGVIQSAGGVSRHCYVFVLEAE
jgi:acetyl-CoA C-acetyltransferase